ncbi:MAG: V-type synthase alpha chain, partial [Proteobacteria bacterium]|nr:V-type synthase alpha chain [Pseudomonadota bacterium]
MPRTGTIVGVNGNHLTVEFAGTVAQNEVAYALLDTLRLKAEVVRVRGRHADLQLFESSAGLRVGDLVEFTGEPLSAELGPGLLGQIYDGLQNPLHALAERDGFFLQRGAVLPALDETRRWPFAPIVKPGMVVAAGDMLGTVPEGVFQHRVMVPFDLRGRWRVAEMAAAGDFRVHETVAVVRNEAGHELPLSLAFRWPVKQAIRLYRERLAPTEPLITQIRILDSLFPVARGGTYCIPGPFGAGKTLLQQLTSRFAQVDIVIIAACGERAGEVVETIRDFPQLTDPLTGRTLMERTIVVANTSSMPVAAREASVYTAVTMAEYYRQMGLHVLLLADSTSRWAQAMRERSGRLEEIPGEEAFPAYLESLIADFYERAGCVRLRDGRIGSLTIGGTISPAGGNFDEPVTRCYPAVDPLQSWSRYPGVIPAERLRELRRLLTKAHEIGQMMKVVGEEGTPLADFILHLKGEFFDAVYLQQNAFDPVDAATPAARQQCVFALLEDLLAARFALRNRDEARAFFQRLRLHVLDLNRAPWGSEAFAEQLRRIRAFAAGQSEGENALAATGPLRLALVENPLEAEI